MLHKKLPTYGKCKFAFLTFFPLNIFNPWLVNPTGKPANVEGCLIKCIYKNFLDFCSWKKK